MQRYIIRIWPDGEAEYLQCNSRGTLSLRVLQDLVGGPIVGAAVIMIGVGDELLGLLPEAAERIAAEWLEPAHAGEAPCAASR